MDAFNQFATVNDPSRFKGQNAARPLFLSYHDVTDPKVWKVALSFFIRRLVYWFFTIFVPVPSKQQTKRVMTLSVSKNIRILIFGTTGSTAKVLRASVSTLK